MRQLAELVQRDVDMATLGTPLKYERDYLNPNHVKCVCDAQGRALYFSRAPIPHFRDSHGAFDAAAAAAVPVLVHLGLYAYHAEALERFGAVPPANSNRSKSSKCCASSKPAAASRWA
ncbi:MAG: hypothetical protein M5U12_09625 [Verrucomicrobia bacterium]|nr:hypothetical protein [Verrucomicrobiota bacterium]